jgi:zinc transporter ZupT
MIRRLVIMGLIAGVPTIAGTWIGGFLYSPLAAVIFLSVGAGAIFQVVYSLISWISHHQKPKTSTFHLQTGCRRLYYGTTNNVFYGLTYMTDVQL